MEYDDLTQYLKIICRNAVKNVSGSNGNRFDSEVKKIAAYLLIRDGKKQYNFHSVNMNFPELSTVRKFINREMELMAESILMFDNLKEFLEKRNYKMEVAVFEDGTKISERIEYDLKMNTLIGLVSPFHSVTGLPLANYHQADTALKIINAVNNNAKSSYIQIILAQPNHTG